MGEIQCAHDWSRHHRHSPHEDREQFRNHVKTLGMSVPPSYIANSFLEGKMQLKKIGFPLVIRPSYTLGGTGGIRDERRGI